MDWPSNQLTIRKLQVIHIDSPARRMWSLDDFSWQLPSFATDDAVSDWVRPIRRDPQWKCCDYQSTRDDLHAWVPTDPTRRLRLRKCDRVRYRVEEASAIRNRPIRFRTCQSEIHSEVRRICDISNLWLYPWYYELLYECSLNLRSSLVQLSDLRISDWSDRSWHTAIDLSRHCFTYTAHPMRRHRDWHNRPTNW